MTTKVKYYSITTRKYVTYYQILDEVPLHLRLKNSNKKTSKKREKDQHKLKILKILTITINFWCFCLNYKKMELSKGPKKY